MSLKRNVLKLGRRAGLFGAARLATSGHLRILGYHGLWVTPGPAFGDCTFISPEQFEARMERLKRSGHPVLGLDAALDGLASDSLPPASVVITIDDGWVSTYTHMLPVLEALDLPATLYATSWYSGRALPVVNVAVQYLYAASRRPTRQAELVAAEIDALPVEQRLGALVQLGERLGVDEAWLANRQFNIMSADQLADSHRRGLDIQLHTHRHIDVRSKVDALASEVEENRAFLAAVTGAAPNHFCYPSGTFHPDAPAVLAASGVRSASLVAEGLNAPGCDPYRLRRLLDGRRVSDVEFDAYLTGALHIADPVRRLLAA